MRSLALLAALALAGCTSAAPAPSPSPSIAVTANVVECTNIQKAYTAWNGILLPSTASDLAEGSLDTLESDGKKFLDAARGYPDQASKELVVRIAEYNYNLSLIGVDLALTKMIKPDHAETVVTSVRAVRAAYDKFRAATCS